MGFVTSDDIEARVKVLCEQMDVDLSTDEDTLVSSRTEDAYQIILSRLGKRGLSKTQIDSWSAGSLFQRDIACFLVISDLLVQNGLNPDVIDYMNREEELDDAALFDGTGAIIEPGAPEDTHGMASVDLEATNDSLGVYG